MFDSLADRTRDQQNHGLNTERLLRLAVVVVVSVLLFGGLYFAVQHLQ
jgi:hypothetical protein